MADKGNWRSYIYNAGEWKSRRNGYFMEAVDAGASGADAAAYANKQMDALHIWAHTGKQAKPLPMSY